MTQLLHRHHESETPPNPNVGKRRIKRGLVFGLIGGVAAAAAGGGWALSASGKSAPEHNGTSTAGPRTPGQSQPTEPTETTPGNHEGHQATGVTLFPSYEKVRSITPDQVTTDAERAEYGQQQTISWSVGSLLELDQSYLDAGLSADEIHFFGPHDLPQVDNNDPAGLASRFIVENQNYLASVSDLLATPHDWGDNDTFQQIMANPMVRPATEQDLQDALGHKGSPDAALELVRTLLAPTLNSSSMANNLMIAEIKAEGSISPKKLDQYRELYTYGTIGEAHIKAMESFDVLYSQLMDHSQDGTIDSDIAPYVGTDTITAATPFTINAQPLDDRYPSQNPVTAAEGPHFVVIGIQTEQSGIRVDYALRLLPSLTGQIGDVQAAIEDAHNF